ncbi:hypothetical protein K440DRAFT_630599 [Wilcoxina mikolae CBS 423.85]|nr:hypothetical protein K440DRAFT_630599 [Wilcoxina mikolae CBS 423.85]
MNCSSLKEAMRKDDNTTVEKAREFTSCSPMATAGFTPPSTVFYFFICTVTFVLKSIQWHSHQIDVVLD